MKLICNLFLNIQAVHGFIMKVSFYANAIGQDFAESLPVRSTCTYKKTIYIK